MRKVRVVFYDSHEIEQKQTVSLSGKKQNTQAFEFIQKLQSAAVEEFEHMNEEVRSHEVSVC